MRRLRPFLMENAYEAAKGRNLRARSADRVVDVVEFGQQAQAEFQDVTIGPDTALYLSKRRSGMQAGHAGVDARLAGNIARFAFLNRDS